MKEIEYDCLVDYTIDEDNKKATLIYVDIDKRTGKCLCSDTVPVNILDKEKADESIVKCKKTLKDYAALLLLCPAVGVILYFSYFFFEMCLGGLSHVASTLVGVVAALTSIYPLPDSLQRYRAIYISKKLKYEEKHREEINKMYEDVKLLDCITLGSETISLPLSKKEFLCDIKPKSLRKLRKDLKSIIKENKEEIEYRKDLLKQKELIESTKTLEVEADRAEVNINNYCEIPIISNETKCPVLYKK